MLSLLVCAALSLGQPSGPGLLVGPSGAPAHRWSASLTVDWGGADWRGFTHDGYPMWARRLSDSHDDIVTTAALVIGAADVEDGPRMFCEICDAALLTGAVTGLIKKVAGVPRPDGSKSNDSFPSGHTSLAFSAATVLADEYPSLRPLWYAFAAGVGITRVVLNRHRLSDVIAGAVVGTWAALTVLDTDRSIMKHLTREFTIGSVEFQFLPRMNPRGITVLQARW
ncbi:MAG: phosphatase PAP2 family protein [Armatimonadetes bacterium]|nr:phosphatase PAP2 family protein [Armatimonadota bacterium]